MSAQMKAALKSIILLDAIFLVVTVLYFLVIIILKSVAPHLLDCGFHEIFHLYCPGCGGTRALIAMLTMHPVKSFLYNPAIISGTAILLFFNITPIYFALRGKGLPQNNKRYTAVRNTMLIMLPIIIVGYCVVRNLLMVYCQIDFLDDLIVYWR